MSSGTRADYAAGGKVATSVAGKFLDTNRRLGMSPRQQMLNRLWAYYACVQYDTRAIDWNGLPHVDGIEHEAIATAGFIPPGFYDAGGQMLPLKFRRPTAPYHLIKVIVDRFTGLLFSERRHPQLRVEGDPDTEDYVTALVEVSRMWQSMIQARAFGGATGTVAVGFKFTDGKPLIEVHDPRWLVPDFIDRSTLKLRSVEKRYMYPVEEKDPESGHWVEVPYWYRRVIDQQADTLWKPIPVDAEQEPEWDNPALIAERVEHQLGFCPVVWIQNIPVLDDVDGEADCHGILSMTEAIDGLLAQANKGTLANCDPTVVIATDAALSEVKKGSDNAIKLPAGGEAKYMEMTGESIKTAMEQAETLRKYALEVAQCVLEHPDMANRTATEIERVYSSMLAKADVLREQYGQKCVLPLVEMMVKAAKQLSEPRVNAEGQMERGVLMLPPKVVQAQGGSAPQKVQRKLGPGGVLKLQWPNYFEPVLNDLNLAVRAAVEARAGGLLDDEHAAKFTAPYFQVEDVNGMLEKVKAERADQQAALDALAMNNPFHKAT